jgi:hypothetical protein
VTPCRNQVRHDPENGTFGDCHRSCVAAILDLDPSQVPHFTQLELEEGRPWLEILREWLSSYGFSYVAFAFLGTETLETVLDLTARNCPGVPLILGGGSAVAPDVGHSVVIMDGKIVMDPSDSGISAPLLNPDGILVWPIEAIAVGPAWGGRLFEARKLAA